MCCRDAVIDEHADLIVLRVCVLMVFGKFKYLLGKRKIDSVYLKHTGGFGFRDRSILNFVFEIIHVLMCKLAIIQVVPLSPL